MPFTSTYTGSHKTFLGGYPSTAKLPNASSVPAGSTAKVGNAYYESSGIAWALIDGVDTTNSDVVIDGALTVSGDITAPNLPKAVGQVALVDGTATVALATVTATTKVFLTAIAGSVANLGTQYVTIDAGVGFTITSTNVLDTSTVAYLVLEAA